MIKGGIMKKARKQSVTLDPVALPDQISAKFWHLVNVLELVMEQATRG
jgi:hypothetical protein